MIKLICDLNISQRGHNAGHVQYIVDNLHSKNGDQIYFLFNKSAQEIINISNSIIKTDNFYFSESDFEKNTLSEKFKFKEWEVIKDYGTRLKIDELFIMELTRFEFQIGRSKVPYKISGIEFRPSHRIKPTNGRISTRIDAAFQKYKRRFFETLMFRSNSLKNVFIFNDSKGAAVLNKLYHTKAFKYLPDPIYNYSRLDDESIAILPVINKEKIIFIIFGSLDWRKNVKNIFEGFSLTDKSIHKDLCILIVGKIPVWFTEFKILVEKFTKENPAIELIIIDKFVSNSEMEYYFSISDVSLVIYSKFYGSSGLIGRAAKYNIISLVPNVGLMAEICTDYQLGYLCDPNAPGDIKDKIVIAYQDIKKNKRVDGTKFYKNHSPERFLQLLNF